MIHMVCRALGAAHCQRSLLFFGPWGLPERPYGLQGGERTKMMQGAVCWNLEFPSCGMMSQT